MRKILKTEILWQAHLVAKVGLNWHEAIHLSNLEILVYSITGYLPQIPQGALYMLYVQYRFSKIENF